MAVATSFVDDWHRGASFSIRWPVTLLAIIIGVVATFTIFWSISFPLGGAVIAPGRVIAEGRNAFVQHLEGGIISAILVTEGQHVEAGQPVARLDPTSSTSQLRRYQIQRDVAEVRLARLTAEQAGAAEVKFSESVKAKAEADPIIAATVEDEQRAFVSRSSGFNESLAMLQNQISAVESEIVGYEDLRHANERQLELVREEVTQQEELFEKRLTRRSQLIGAQRKEAEIDGTVKGVTARITTSRSKIAELASEAERLKSDRLSDINDQIIQLRSDYAAATAMIESLQDIAARTEIRAPVSGTIVKIAQNSTEAVISPGGILMEILPEGAPLVIEALVEPKNIERISIGGEARIVFSTIDALKRELLEGTVSFVAADKTIDEKTGEAFYPVRVRLQDGDERISFIVPGIEAELYFNKEDETFWDMLKAPLSRVAQRAFQDY